MITRLWNERVVPRMIEAACGGSTIERQRAKIIPRAEGRVLEIGIGSGLNLPHYQADRVESLVGVDPSQALMRKAEARVRDVAFEVELHETSAERLPFEDASFDTAVVTYTLCSIPDEGAALYEVRRVLRTDGALLLSEHGLAPDAWPERVQHLLDPAWHRFGGGCHLDRDVTGYLRRAGFDVSALEAMYLPGPRWLNWHTWGRAEVV